MKQFRDLEHGREVAYKRGEFLWVWLNELKATCKSDKSFMREIQRMFINPEGVYEYWEENRDKYTE